MSYASYAINDREDGGALRMADCNRTIELYFYEKTTSQRKFYRLYNLLTEFGQKLGWLEEDEGCECDLCLTPGSS